MRQPFRRNLLGTSVTGRSERYFASNVRVTYKTFIVRQEYEIVLYMYD